jgi:DNA invertase Pin-like site-specific DNA recombinase
MTQNNEHKNVKAALYCRCSTNHQTVDTQLDELRRAATARGWEVVGEFVDEAVSGGTRNRPQLDRLMQAARRGEISAILVQRFDRFARSTQHLLSALEEFRCLNVSFTSLHENIDTASPSGKLLFVLIAAISEFEKSLINERIASGLQRAKRQGIRLGRPRRDDLDLKRVQRLQASGTPIAEIARMLELPRSTIRSALARDGEKVSR